MMQKYEVEDCLCLIARLAARLLTQHYDEALQPTGLRVTQFQLLAALSKMGPTSHQPLADKLGVDRTTLTRNLKVLERGGLVRLRAERSDRRTHVIGLTAEGRKRLRPAMVIWTAVHANTLARIEKDAGLPGFKQVLEVVRRASNAK